ncbi:MAG: uracil-DNA glycosylase [Pirellulaceae bacterium]|jgi:DNA polymerase|nr:uracil-DNA glycosylase [Pirellulaceae bacterium]MDP6719278.1 uracil-DNA glycosylase [Pirellulaceae bacterium]
MTALEDSQRIQRIALQRLESLQRAGVLQLPKAAVIEDPAEEPVDEIAVDSPQIAKEPALPPTKAAAKVTAAMKTTGQKTATQETTAKSSLSKCKEELALIQHEVARCTLCGELVENRTQTVFGVGNPQARLCFFGEAPGADEDRQGEPFVGRAGKLLNDIISKGMGLTRDEIYILNVLKCRPPGNRNPAPDEVTNCRQFFERQLETIQPEFICCLGAIAAQSLLETTTSVGRLRGHIHDYKGISVVVTYHPAYLLRKPATKTETWKDIKILLDAMELPIPKRS